MTNRDVDEIAQLLKPTELAPLSGNPLVSVLMASYNYAQFLPKAIESVLAQTYTNLELIVCDDGSTDKSCEVAQHYARRESRIKVIRKKNGGMSSAQNAAYRESRGHVICLLDADDRYFPHKLETVVNAFRSNPQSGFASHRMLHTDANGRFRGVTPLMMDPPNGWYGPRVVLHGDVPYGLGFGSGLCLRREISDLIFPLPEALRFNSDVAITALVPLLTPLIGITVPLTEYRLHGQNAYNSARLTPEFSDRELRLNKTLWELRKGYLESVHPRLGELFPSFDERLGTLVAHYVRLRLTGDRGVLVAYRRFLRATSFETLGTPTKWFWRLSILLPRQLFRSALRPSRLKQLIWQITRGRRARYSELAGGSAVG